MTTKDKREPPEPVRDPRRRDEVTGARHSGESLDSSAGDLKVADRDEYVKRIERLLRQRDDIVFELRECDRINNESMATIQRLERRWEIASAFIRACADVYDGSLERHTHGGLLGFVRSTIEPLIARMDELHATFTATEVEDLAGELIARRRRTSAQ